VSSQDVASDDEVLKSARRGLESESEFEVKKKNRWGCGQGKKYVNEVKQLEDVIKKLFEEQSSKKSKKDRVRMR
jgi:hypothetical protein